MAARLDGLLIYTPKIDETAAFYSDHFGYSVRRSPGDRIVKLVPHGPGATILLHAASKGQRAGQTQVKLVFTVADVAAFCAEAAERGLASGPIHAADGYAFANLKDPSGNSVQVSSRPRG